MTPDGIICHFWGPFPGTRHDAAVLHESGLLPRLVDLVEGGEMYSLYGDAAYPRSPHILCGFKGTFEPSELEFNRRMSQVRESVEWGFARTWTQLWQSLSFKKELKLYQQALGKLFPMAVFLSNCKTCFDGGNQVSDYFDLKPPSLETYLSRYSIE